jgi:acyl-coenzyme A synthetase/AMP-(fatty) acid ligase
VKEFCVFAANYLWPQHTMANEELVIVIRLEPDQEVDDALRADIAARNQRLRNYKRISGYLVYDRDFPRTASMKIKRTVLAEDVGRTHARSEVVPV